MNTRVDYMFTAVSLSLVLLGMTGCQSQPQESPTPLPASSSSSKRAVAPPAVPEGPLATPTAAALDTAITALTAKRLDTKHLDAIDTIGASKDPRTAWLLADMLRIANNRSYAAALEKSASRLLMIPLDGHDNWTRLTNHLIAWDIPAPPDYLKRKADIFTKLVPEWKKLFVKPGDTDWRHVSWGGVDIDARPYNQTHRPCRCIPAADNPMVVSAAKGNWLADDAIVFGVDINGEARAYPRFIMEIREMVNDTLGGRDFGMPYCTLCGSAQVWFTDRVPADVKRPVLRTSGLLIRSNKLMYDVHSWSVFDTFLGRATAGSLYEKSIQLPAGSVITTTWGEWKREHPHTTLLDQSLALGRKSDLRNTRDANGPIFPIGDTDPRLPVQEDVLGVITAKGQAIAFHVPTAITSLEKGNPVFSHGIHLHLDSGGLIAKTLDGKPYPSHQAFWFAWSQFHPKTLLWE